LFSRPLHGSIVVLADTVVPPFSPDGHEIDVGITIACSQATHAGFNQRIQFLSQPGRIVKRDQARSAAGEAR
jgi:hypothetical protein